jgi:hypothetical protein
MLTLIHMPTVPGIDFSRDRESETAITRKASSSWRRFMDALMRALSAWSV